MMRSDDDLATINREFLGPPGWTFLWRARFTAYGIASVLTVTALFLFHVFGVPVNVWTLAWGGLVVVGLTRHIGAKIGYETPLRSFLTGCWHEISAPRQDDKPFTAVLRPSRVRVRDTTGREMCRGCLTVHQEAS